MRSRCLIGFHWRCGPVRHDRPRRLPPEACGAEPPSLKEIVVLDLRKLAEAITIRRLALRPSAPKYRARPLFAFELIGFGARLTKLDAPHPAPSPVAGPNCSVCRKKPREFARGGGKRTRARLTGRSLANPPNQVSPLGRGPARYLRIFSSRPAMEPSKSVLRRTMARRPPTAKRPRWLEGPSEFINHIARGHRQPFC